MSEESKSLPDPQVRFAADRTLLAWVRTSLTLIALGFAIGRFSFFEEKNTSSADANFSIWLGTALVVLGAVANVVAAYRFTIISRKLKRGEHFELSSFSPELLLTIILSIIGLLMAFKLSSIS